MISPIIHDKSVPTLPNGEVCTPSACYRLFGYDKHPEIKGYRKPPEFVPIILADDVYQRAKVWREKARGREKQTLGRLLERLRFYFRDFVGVNAEDEQGQLWDDMDSLEEALKGSQLIFTKGFENILYHDHPDLNPECVQKMCLALTLLCELLTGQAMCLAIKMRNDALLDECIRIVESQILSSIGGSFALDFTPGRQKYVDLSVRKWVEIINDWVKIPK